MKDKSFPLQTLSDKPPLPTGWCWVTLGDVTESMKNGIYRPASSYSDDGIACLRMYNIDQGKIVWRDIKRMTLREDEIEEYELLSGDLLLNRVNSRELVGKTVAIPPNFERCVFESKNIRVRLRRDVVVPEYVCYRLLAEGSRYFMENAQQVVGMASINQSQVASFPLPLAPINEQRRIVAEIEKQFTRLDAGVAALRQIQANLKRYRAAVLKSACEGRLVPTESELARVEDRPFESGGELHARILNERRQKWQGRGEYKAPAPADTERLPLLPAGWVWATVDQLAAPEPNSITDGPFGSNLKTKDYTSYGPRVIRLQNIGDGVFLDAEAHITQEHFDRLWKHRIYANDVVIAGFGENPPRSCLVPEGIGPAMVKADCIRFKPHCDVLPKYMNIVLNSDPVRRRTKEMVHGVGRPRLNLGEIRSIALPLPSFAEQTRIVAEVERRLSVVEELEAAVSSNLQRANGMRLAVLHKAFCGQLADQDSGDETADAMVRRAKANPNPPRPLLRKPTKQSSKSMPLVPIDNLDELLTHLDALGGSSAPNRLLMDLNLGNDVERFFDLLRAGRDKGKLLVPTGESGTIRRVSHAS